jgi:long-subunit fatty acid transport protein
MLRDLALLTILFVLVTAVASALGAANLGTAATFGQIAFVLALTALLVRR